MNRISSAPRPSRKRGASGIRASRSHHLLAMLLALLLPLLSPPATADDHTYELVWTEEIIYIGDIPPPLTFDVPYTDPFPFDGEVDVGGIGSGWEDKIFAHWADPVQRPGLQILEDTAKEVVASQLGVDVDQALLHGARGQIKALTFIRLMDIINTPAADRIADEQLVYNEIQTFIRERRLAVVDRAFAEYNRWVNDPCGYTIPVGDAPNAYLEKPEMANYCSLAAAGNSLALLFVEPSAIKSSLYLNWAEQLRIEAMLRFWLANYCVDCQTESDEQSQVEFWQKAMGDAYIETEQAMAFHQASGLLLNAPEFDFTNYTGGETSLAAGMKSMLTDFGGNYVRDFMGTILLTTIVKGPSGLVPDIHDMVILASLVAASTALELVDQVESRGGIVDAAQRVNQNLETVISSPTGRAELLLALVELSMPDDLRYVSWPYYLSLQNQAFYPLNDPTENTVIVQDWGRNYLMEGAPWVEVGYHSQGLFSRVGVDDGTYAGFTSNIRFIDGNGDFKTAWLFNEGNTPNPKLLVTTYARQLTSAEGEPARVVVQQLFNNVCPQGGTFNFNTPPTDYGLSCVQSITGNGVAFTQDLAPGDSVIVGGRVATVKEVISSYAFTTRSELGGGQYVPVHKILDPDGVVMPTNSFDYLALDNTTQTAVLDVGSAPPQISLPLPTITVEATAIETPVNLGSATASDFLDGAVPVTSDAPALFPLGSTLVTYTATDSDGNVAEAFQTVMVVDTTAPVFGALPIYQKEATAPMTPVDLINPPVTEIFSAGVIYENDSPGSFPVGNTTVRWTATDASGNTGSGSQVVTIVDTTPPVFTSVPAPVEAEATGPLTDVALGLATATDLVGVSVANDAPAEGFPLGETLVTWTATDPSGNSVSGSQRVTVKDTTPPMIAIPQAEITVEASAVNTPVDLGTVSASDLVDGLTQVANDAPAAFPLGTTVVTYTSVDNAGNTGTAVQTVHVVDTTPPVFTLAPATINQVAIGESSIPDLGTPEANDIFEVTITNNAPASLPVGTTVITWAATDTSGNTTTVEQVVTLTYQYSGLLSPVSEGGVYKINRVLPLRFSLQYADGSLASEGVANLTVLKASSEEVNGEGIVVSDLQTGDSGNQFVYNGGQYLFKLATKGRTVGIYNLQINLNDGQSYRTQIALK